MGNQQPFCISNCCNRKEEDMFNVNADQIELNCKVELNHKQIILPGSPPTEVVRPYSLSDDEIEQRIDNTEMDFGTLIKQNTEQVGPTTKRVTMLTQVSRLRRITKTSKEKYVKILNFKNYKGFKWIEKFSERYQLGRILGEGTFGFVQMGLHRHADLMCAIKIIKKTDLEKDQALMEELEDELRILEEVCHPMIIQVYELLHDADNLYIVSEYMRYGQLNEYIRNRNWESHSGAMIESEVKHVAFQIFYALNYMHGKGIMHRDIKPENILIESLKDLRIKLADFGFATCKTDSYTTGNPKYMAPEILKKERYDSKVDVWAAGVVIFFMITGSQPFNGTTPAKVFADVVHKPLTFVGAEWLQISNNAKDFLELCLKKDPKQRASAKDLLQHPWLQIERS